MKTYASIGCILGVLFLTVFGSSAMAAENTEAAITIGVLENQNYAFAAMMKGSFNLSLEMINAKGGINGRPVQLVFANDGGQKKEGIQAVKYLIRDQKAVMLVGGYSSSNTIYMAQTAESMDVPFLVCTAADDRITQRAMKNIYRINPPSSEYATGLENLMTREIKPASMAIIYENSPYGTSGAMRMMWFCRDNDIEITAIIPYHKERVGAEYFQHLIEPLRLNQPQIIYMVSYMKDGVQLVKQIREAKIDSLLTGGAGGFTHPDFIKMAGEASKHFMTATLWWADQQHDLAGEYAALYRAKYQQSPDYHGAEAYSALLVAVDVLKRSQSLAARDIRAALDQTNLRTPFGSVQFKAYGKYERQNSRQTLVLQNIDNKYGCIWPEDLSVAKFVLPAR
jgi:branched-chain amino acid transport system substrate-binding protein